MSDTPTTDWNEVGLKLLYEMKRIAMRVKAHPDDTDADRRRLLYHVESIANAAIASAEGRS